MALWWRCRKRKYINLLDALEDMTEGMVRTKTCLKGSGSIAIKSDKVAVVAALETACVVVCRKKKMGWEFWWWGGGYTVAFSAFVSKTEMGKSPKIWEGAEKPNNCNSTVPTRKLSRRHKKYYVQRLNLLYISCLLFKYILYVELYEHT